MNLPKIDLIEAVAALLARGEPLTAAQLAASTGKSVSSISLAVKALGERVHRIGAARSTRYALRQDILGLPASCAIVWASHLPEIWGRLTYLQGDWLHVQNGKNEWLTQHQLPWFLASVRPQGFLGRALLQGRPSFPGDPDALSLSQVLNLLISSLHDPVGAFFVGAYLSLQYGTPNEDMPLAAYYDLLAEKVGSGLPVGSSAAGEQPKFVVSDAQGIGHIVKFSPPRGTPYGQRWHILLQLEKLALDILKTHGISTATTELMLSEKRSYLQSRRFDRDPVMRHIVAIEAVHKEFVGKSRDNWVMTSQALHAQKLISENELQTIARIHAFGHYIGNTDMHFGNLSFFVDDVLVPKISLAPVYDMLPMMWKPDPHQGLSDSPVRQQPLPAGFAQEQEQARAWAIEFWERAAQLNIGAELQAASVESAHRLKTNFANL